MGISLSNMTQLELAKRGKISWQMRFVAEREKIKLRELKEKIAKGWVVILANKNHQKLKPLGIGDGLKIKVNANIGTSPIKVDLRKELRKLKVAIEAKTDTVMDLSCGGKIDKIRRNLIKRCPLPIGTVPIYQAVLEAEGIKNLNLDIYLSVLEKQAKDGIDFMTVHAGVRKKFLPLVKKRLIPCVSRGGNIILRWMRYHKKESFLFEGFKKILEVAKKYDVTLSLGDGLRPGCLADATDTSQIEELKTLGKLHKLALNFGVQTIIEGPGHIPLNEIELNIKLEKKYCQKAPFFVLGPLPIDIGATKDDIGAAIGGAVAGWKGADFLCYVTRKEHIGLPEVEDVKEGVKVARLAVEIAEIAKGNKEAILRNYKMSKARREVNWKEMFKYSLFPKELKKLREKEVSQKPALKKAKFCSMCGDFCVFF